MKGSAIVIAYIIMAGGVLLGMLVMAGVAEAQKSAIAVACVESGGTWDGFGGGKCTR